MPPTRDESYAYCETERSALAALEVDGDPLLHRRRHSLFHSKSIIVQLSRIQSSRDTFGMSMDSSSFLKTVVKSK